MFSCIPDIEHDHNEYENARIRRTILDAMEPTRSPPTDSCSKYDPKDYSELEVSKADGLSCSPIKVPILIWQGFIGCILACILHPVSCISSTSLHRQLLSLLIIYVKMPCPSIINTYSICHHTMFFHSNVVLVYQTSKRKMVTGEHEGVQTNSLKKVVVPAKSDSTPLMLAVEPATQNLSTTPADCTHTPLAI